MTEPSDPDALKPYDPADPHGEAEIPLRTRLNSETGILSCDELLPHFARGVVLRVSNEVDLIDAAEVIIRDDKIKVEKWIEHARDWVKRTPSFWCVVSAPWVLAQEKLTH